MSHCTTGASATARRNEKPLVVFFLDLNGMKQINDKLGQEIGDQALVATGEVLRACFRESVVRSRLGGHRTR